MKVKITANGRIAHPKEPRTAQIEARVGDVLDLDQVWASTLIGAGRAEAVEDEADEAPAAKPSPAPKGGKGGKGGKPSDEDLKGAGDGGQTVLS